ncbi:hypothetical protein MUG84_16765 [Paenibacillus sp. KQZ6P-2]|uniref:Uncharacterized protein n=1 Tax=Paenibacillus mangrovi TaxID=2931978 RepID=A0A9X2B748_9BACL|nr:hypothetical protein [Paenibacillus mangrovi]MCJ8013383.1 hypothetical protein [Paenibacillus mangrovi]
MGQLKVRFTIEHRDAQNSFTSLSDLKQHSFSDLVLRRLYDFENQLRRAAADVWLHQRLGKDNRFNLQVAMVQEGLTLELTEYTPKA